MLEVGAWIVPRVCVAPAADAAAVVLFASDFMFFGACTACQIAFDPQHIELFPPLKSRCDTSKQKTRLHY